MAKNPRRSLEELSYKELICKRLETEKNLEISFQNLSRFVDDSEGHFFSDGQSKRFDKLEGYYNKYRNIAEELNSYLKIKDRIDLSYHDELMDRIDKKNFNYINEECDKIRREKREREDYMDYTANFTIPEFTIPEVRDPKKYFDEKYFEDK